MELFYNGHTYTFTPAPIRHMRPRAINWRHQVPGEVIEPTTPVELTSRSINPQSVNWRYRVPGLE
jgi:hypothetical protein